MDTDLGSGRSLALSAASLMSSSVDAVDQVDPLVARTESYMTDLVADRHAERDRQRTGDARSSLQPTSPAEVEQVALLLL